MAGRRRLFEQIEGRCDHCRNALRSDRSRAVLNRYSVKGLVVCDACYEYDRKYDTMTRQPRIKLKIFNNIKARTRYNKYKQEKLKEQKNIIRREKTRIQREMPVEELLEYIRGKK